MPEEVKRAAGYIRVSTVEQSLKGLSIETQIAEIKAYAEYHGMRLEEIYIDRGITARKSLEKRVEFMRMMRDINAGKLNHIIVLRLDRFFRNVYDYHKMMNEYLNPNNCDWSAVKEQYTTTTTNGRLMINLRLAIAEQECDTDSDRIKDVHSHIISKGYVISPSHPIGLKIVKKKMVKDEETNHIAVDMFDQFELTNSVRGTMNYLNAKYGLSLIYSTVHRALRNPLYAGICRDNHNYCEPTISPERHKKILQLLKKNIKEKKEAQDYVFTGLVYCAHCGASMSGNCTHKMLKSGDNTYRYYRCPKRTRDCICDNNISIREAEIEDYLLKYGKQKLQEKCLNALAEREKKTVKSNRKQIEKKMERLNDLYINGFISLHKYREDFKSLEDQMIDDPTDEPIDLSKHEEFLISEYENVYHSLNDLERRALWRPLIKKIMVSGKEIKDIIFF